jgi:hypothetical protein
LRHITVFGLFPRNLAHKTPKTGKKGIKKPQNHGLRASAIEFGIFIINLLAKLVKRVAIKIVRP